jgi:hypothetical protein
MSARWSPPRFVDAIRSTIIRERVAGTGDAPKMSTNFEIITALENMHALEHPHLRTGLIVIGAVVVLSYVFTFLKGIYARVLRGGKDLKRTYGQWGKIPPVLVIVPATVVLIDIPESI